MELFWNRQWLALSAAVFLLASCEKEPACQESVADAPFDISDYEFVIDASMSTDPDPKLDVTTAAWETGDQIFISLDGSESNVYVLKYDSSLDKWGIYNVPGASDRGFEASGSLSALYCSNPNLGMTSGKLQGTTLGDVVYTTAGTYTKADRVITVSITLDQRPVSILRVEGAGSSLYAENMTNNHTTLTSLSSMSWDSSASQPSYSYDSVADVAYCYGTLPAGGTVRLRQSGGDRRVFTRTYAGKSLATGKMATLKGPGSSESAYWTEDMSEYYETGQVITYQKKRDSRPYTIVVLGDGFTAYDLREGGVFETAARKSMDYLFSIEPYSKMQDLFNVYFICARSNERGASVGGVTRDTYFGVHWTSSTSYGDMDVKSPSAMKTFVNNNCPDITGGLTDHSKTGILILVNTSTYAGLCRSETNGGNYCMLPSASTSTWAWSNPLGLTMTQGNYLNLVAHEFGGHAIGRLGDEYYHDGDGAYTYSILSNPLRQEHNWTVPFSRNLTYDGSDYEWSWMAGADYANEGLYEGGYSSYATGVWRPEIISCMFDNRPYYNAWSRYLIMERVYSVCGETFNQGVFLSKDSGRSRYDEPATRPVVASGVSGPVEIVPMLPPPVFVEQDEQE